MRQVWWGLVRGGCTLACMIGCSSDDAGDKAPPANVFDAYADAWNEPDAELRWPMLESSTVGDIVVIEPTRVLASRQEVSDAIGQFHSETPGGSVNLLGNVREHDGRLWLEWDGRDGQGTELARGFDWMKLAPDRRIARVHSFFGALPAPVALDPVQQAFIDAWNEPDAPARLADLETAVADEIELVIEGAPTASGREALSARIAVELEAHPGRERQLTTGFLQLPDAWSVQWRSVAADGTTELEVGVLFAALGADGRMSEAVFFASTVP